MAENIEEQIEKRKITPPGPADFVRGNVYGRPGVALPTSKETKPEPKEEKKPRVVRTPRV